MVKLTFLTPVLLASLLAVTACGGDKTSNSSPSPSPSPTTAESPSQSPAAEAAPTASTSAIAETYKQKDGLFEISFPAGYQYKESGSGIAFVSPDKHFSGSVDYDSAPSTDVTPVQLEASLKAEYEKRLKTVKWQGSEPQPDGSIRVDWVGKDKDNNDLDAISFVEKRGNNVFILSLFAINKPYQDYNADAEAIVGTYKVRQ